jgi:hypothetical protein
MHGVQGPARGVTRCGLTTSGPSRASHRPAATAGADLPQFLEDEFDAVVACGILAHRFLRLRCADYGHDKLDVFSCKLQLHILERHVIQKVWAPFVA